MARLSNSDQTIQRYRLPSLELVQEYVSPTDFLQEDDINDDPVHGTWARWRRGEFHDLLLALLIDK